MTNPKEILETLRDNALAAAHGKAEPDGACFRALAEFATMALEHQVVEVSDDFEAEAPTTPGGPTPA